MAKKKVDWGAVGAIATIVSVFVAIGIWVFSNQAQSVQTNNNNVTASDQAVAVGTINGNPTFNTYNQASEAIKPAISMNVEVLSDNPFDADFLISNGSLVDAENVKVKILFFDYLVGADDKCKLYLILDKLSENDKILRSIGLIKAGANRINTKIYDLVTYGTDSVLGFSGCGTRTISGLTVLSDDGKNILALPPEQRSFFRSSLVCFEVDYDWKDQNKIKEDYAIFGFILDKDKSGNSWLPRSNICTSEFVQSRVDDMGRITERDRFR